MNEAQVKRVAQLDAWPGKASTFEVSAGAVLAVHHNTRGDVTWFELVDQQASMMYAWDTGAERA